MKSLPLVPSADNLCKQFGLRSGLTKRGVCSEYKLFDSLMVFLKKRKFILEKNWQMTKNMGTYPVGEELTYSMMNQGVSCFENSLD